MQFDSVFTSPVAILVAVAAILVLPGIGRGDVIFESNVGNIGAGHGTVGEYTTTGAVVNAAIITGLTHPIFMAASGNDLFITDYDDGIVSEYTTSGVKVNAALVTGGAEGITISGDHMFVSYNTTVREYTTSGTLINGSLVTGLQVASNVQVEGNDLFVLSAYLIGQYQYSKIGEYDATTGAAINASLVTGLINAIGLTISGSDMYVTNSNTGTILEYTTAGTLLNASFITGVGPGVLFDMAVSNGDLFVSQGAGSSLPIGEYNAVTGATINANLIPNLQHPAGFVVIPTPEPSGLVLLACGAAGLALWAQRGRLLIRG